MLCNHPALSRDSSNDTTHSNKLYNEITVAYISGLKWMSSKYK